MRLGSDGVYDQQTDLACALLEDLRNAADIDGPPLDADTLPSLVRGLAGCLRGTCEAAE